MQANYVVHPSKPTAETIAELRKGLATLAKTGHLNRANPLPVHVQRGGEQALITGDMIHSPLQARYPELGMMSDYDSPEAGRSRRASVRATSGSSSGCAARSAPNAWTASGRSGSST